MSQLARRTLLLLTAAHAAANAARVAEAAALAPTLPADDRFALILTLFGALWAVVFTALFAQIYCEKPKVIDPAKAYIPRPGRGIYAFAQSLLAFRSAQRKHIGRVTIYAAVVYQTSVMILHLTGAQSSEASQRLGFAALWAVAIIALTVLLVWLWRSAQH